MKTIIKIKAMIQVLFAKVLVKGQDRLEPTPQADASSSSAYEAEEAEFGVEQLAGAKKLVRKRKTKHLKKAFRAFLELVHALPKTQEGWQMLILGMVCMFADLAFSMLPGIPLIMLDGLTTIPPFLRALADCFTPFDQLKGDGKIKRPSIIEAYIPTGFTVPSTDIIDYIGGHLKTYYIAKRMVWVPLFCSFVGIAHNVPDNIVSMLVSSSPLAGFFICGKRSIKSTRPQIQIAGDSFQTFDPDIVNAIAKYLTIIRAQLLSFSLHIRDKKKRWEKIKDEMPKYFPVARVGKYIEILDNHPTVAIWAAGLAIFRAMLDYAVENKWVAKDKADEYFREAWNAVLPESSPEPPPAEGACIATRWDSPEVFWAFTQEYLEQHQVHISPQDVKCGADTVAALRITNNEEHLVVPRARFTSAYAGYIHTHSGSIPESNFELQLIHKLKEWGIGLRTEGEDISWRFKFYVKGQAPKGEKEKQPCIGIPVRQLPERVLGLLPGRSDYGSGGEICPTRLRAKPEHPMDKEVTGNA